MLTNELRALHHYLATSDDAVASHVRSLRQRLTHLEITPNAATLQSMLYAYRGVQSLREFTMRVFVCQPLLRAHCKECGPGLRTGDLIHFIQGDGDILLGSNVWLDGKASITFAARFAERPTLIIGDNSGLGHDTELVIGKRITIGRNTNISGATRIFDSNGHPADAVARRNHAPPGPDDVRPVTIGDDVWVGKDCLIFPGVRIGNGAIISAGSVVRKHVPPYAVVAGNPAQVVFRLRQPTVNGEATNGAADSEPIPPVAESEKRATAQAPSDAEVLPRSAPRLRQS